MIKKTNMSYQPQIILNDMDKNYTLLTKIQFFELYEVGKDKLVVYNNQRYHVGDMFYDCIIALKRGEDLKKITLRLNNKHQTDFMVDEVGHVLVSAIDNIEKQSKQKSIGIIDNIYIKKKIIGQENINRIAKSLIIFYDNRIVSVVFLLFALSFYYIFEIKWAKLSFATGYVTENLLLTFLLSYLLLPLIGFFHEFGHATASLKLNIRPKEIGLGLFLVFPVFYTDVSDIWKINKWKRVIVNFGGIYFQIILSCFLTVLLAFVNDLCVLSIILSMFTTNLLMMAYAAFPFFKNDGYWIYSDLFHIPNLSYRSRHCPIVLRKLISNRDIQLKEKFNILKANIALIIYCFFDIILTTCMMASILVMTVWNIAQIMQYISYFGYTHVVDLIPKGLFITMSIVLNGVFLYRISSYLISLLRKKLLL